MRQNETVESVCLVLLHVNQVASESFGGPVAKTLFPIQRSRFNLWMGN